jgi:hypothetical protein
MLPLPPGPDLFAEPTTLVEPAPEEFSPIDVVRAALGWPRMERRESNGPRVSPGGSSGDGDRARAGERS